MEMVRRSAITPAFAGDSLRGADITYLEYPALYLAHSSRNTQQMVAVMLNAKQIHACQQFFLEDC